MRLFNVRQIFCLALVSASLLSAGSATEGLIKQVQDRYNGARTLSVNFEEQYSIQSHARPAEAGVLTLQKQGKMRWDYSRPEGKLFVSDGKNVFLYTSWDNRVEKVPLRDTEDMRAPLAFLLGRLDMKKEFGSFEAHAGDGGTWLDAYARNDRVLYKKVEMLIVPDGSIRQLKVVGQDTSLLSFSFNNEKLNPPVEDKVFHFTIPPGAEVVDSMAYGSQGK